jgi:hypothetical protein
LARTPDVVVLPWYYYGVVAYINSAESPISKTESPFCLLAIEISNLLQFALQILQQNFAS